jgi:hypothetical protein
MRLTKSTGDGSDLTLRAYDRGSDLDVSAAELSTIQAGRGRVGMILRRPEHDAADQRISPPGKSVFLFSRSCRMTHLGDRGPTRTTRVDMDRWTRVKARLRAELGEKVFASWFGRMELDGIDDGTVHLTVPTKFLKGWIQARYADCLLACWKGEHELVARIKVETRSAVVRIMRTKPQAARSAESVHKVRSCARTHMDDKISAPATAIKREAIAGSPLDPLLTFNTFRGWRLKRSCARGRQTGRRIASRRSSPL